MNLLSILFQEEFQGLLKNVAERQIWVYLRWRWMGPIPLAGQPQAAKVAPKQA